MSIEDGYPVPSRSSLSALIREHWRTHARDLHRDLVRTAELASESERKADETIAEAEARQRSGANVREAWEAAMRNVALSVPR